MTISAADLTSDMVDLTTFSLRGLREARKQQVAVAVDEFMAGSSFDALGEIQMQNE